MENSKVPRWQLLAITVFSIVPFVRFSIDISLGFDHLIWARLGDDSFYYFEISKHIPYFNDSVPTSGFHPLYAILIAPLHRNLANEPAVVGSLAILILGYCVGTWLVWILVKRYFGQLAGLAAAGAWAVSGYLYTITMTGVETILAIVFVVAALAFYPDTVWRNRSTRPFIVFAILLALSFYARMDAPLVLMPFAVLLGFSLIYQRRWPLILLVVGIPLISVLIWLGYIKVQTGEIFPGSGTALRVIWDVSDQLILTDPIQITLSLISLLKSVSYFFVSIPTMRWFRQALLIIFLGIPVILGINFIFRQRRKELRMTRIYIVLLATGIALWAAYYVFHHGGFRIWYFAYLALLAYCLIVPMSIIGFESTFSNRKHVAVYSFAIVALTAVLSRPFVFGSQLYDKYQSAIALNLLLEDLPDESRVGSFNTGIYDYFTTADIINLDGVVNPEARRAIEADMLPEYLASHNISYLIEHDIGQAKTLNLLSEDTRVVLEKIIDFRDYYEPYAGGQYKKSTFLWHAKLVE